MILLPLPVGSFRFTQKYGARPRYYKKYGLNGHNGVDLAPNIPGTVGQLIYAPHEGYVRIGREGKIGYGNFAQITSLPYNREGMCHRSDLAHLMEFLVEDGQYVPMNEPIGKLGGNPGMEGSGDSSGAQKTWTYKKMRDGATLFYDNGYHGALDIGRYARQWVLSTLL